MRTGCYDQSTPVLFRPERLIAGTGKLTWTRNPPYHALAKDHENFMVNVIKPPVHKKIGFNSILRLTRNKKTEDASQRPTQKIPVASSRLEGFFDGILSSGELFGWAYDKDNPLERLTLYFSVEGIALGEVKADQYRADLSAANKSDGHCAFMFANVRLETLASLKRGTEIRAFYGPDYQQELPHSPLRLTEQTARQLIARAIAPNHDNLAPNSLKYALTAMLRALQDLGNEAEADNTYLTILKLCHQLLQTGEYGFLRQQLELTLKQQVYSPSLPAFDLTLVRAIADQNLGELDESDLMALEACLFTELQRPTQAMPYPDPMRDIINAAYQDCHLRLLKGTGTLGALAWRLLHILSMALAKLYGDLVFACNIMATLHRTNQAPLNAIFLEQSAKINRSQEKNFEALQDLVAAMGEGSESAWVYQETAALQAMLCEGRIHLLRQNLSDILALLRRSNHYDLHRGSQLQHQADLLLRCFFQECTGNTALAARNGASAAALAQRREDMRTLIDALATLPQLAGGGYYQGPAQAARPAPRRFRQLLFVGSKTLWQCYMYRVEQKMEQAQSLGYQTSYRDIDALDDGSWKQDMLYADAVYVCRVPAVYTICLLIIYARHLQIPVIYDIDDYLFDERYFPAPLASYAGTIDEALHTHLLMDNPFFEYALKLADYITCSTPPLAEKIATVVGTAIPVAVHPNLLSPKLYQSARQASPPDQPNDGIEIFYGSATKAHKQIIYEVFGPALRQILQRFPKVKFTAFGYFQLPPELEPYADRIEFHEPTTNRGYYLQQLSAADINIAALEQDPFTDCKSEIKWLEAAVFGIPSVVTPTATYRAALAPEQHVLFASAAEEWQRQLTRLIESAELRQHIGNNARLHALDHFSPTVGASILDRTLKATIRTDAVIKPQKPRLLYVNVWFAPQAVGGATRVFESHVRFLMENYGDQFELQVLTTQLHPQGLAPYSTEQFHFGPVLVTRLNVPLRDWSEAYDSEVYAFCLEFFLKQQIDFIHFHALPVITASPVDAARKLAIPYAITLHDGWWLSQYMFLMDDSGHFVDHRRAFSNPAKPARQQQLFDCLNDAHALLAVSAPFRDIYRQAGFKQTRSNENGLDVFEILPRSKSASGKVRVAHIGGMSQHKGYQLLREAVTQSQFKHIEIHIIDHSLETGETYQGQWGQTQAYFRAKYKQSEINRLYAGMDVLVAPSIWPEAFGLVTREAAYAGVWTIASDRGAVGDCIVDGVNGRIITVDDSTGLKLALQEIDDNPDTFLQPCPSKTPRTVAEQMAECLAIYPSVLSPGD